MAVEPLKLEESFNALYEWARTCERHDQQYRPTSFISLNSGTKQHKFQLKVKNHHGRDSPVLIKFCS